MLLEIVPATPAHAASLAPRLRPQDAREVRLAYGHSPAQALRASLAACAGPRGKAFAVLADGVPEILFGVAPLSPLSDTGLPWMLSSGVRGCLVIPFVRHCAAYLADLGRDFRRLENFVHADNALSVRWLARLGFAFDPPAPWGLRGALFRKFWKEMKTPASSRGEHPRINTSCLFFLCKKPRKETGPT